jgi:hypothetical protein
VIPYTIDATAHVVVLEYAEDAPFDDWSLTMDAVLRDASFRPGFGFLLDRSRLTTAPSTAYIQRIVAYVQKHPTQLGGSRVATLVSSNAAYGMTRMAEILLDPMRASARGFTDRAEALEWLRAADGPRAVT